MKCLFLSFGLAHFSTRSLRLARRLLASDDRYLFYKDETGVIKGWHGADGYFYVQYWSINKELRGKGLARALFSHLPYKVILSAIPEESPNALNKEELVDFYERLGFREIDESEHGWPIMQRG